MPIFTLVVICTGILSASSVSQTVMSPLLEKYPSAFIIGFTTMVLNLPSGVTISSRLSTFTSVFHSLLKS